MTEPFPDKGTLTMDRLFELHKLTKELSRYCHRELTGYLETMAPLLRPRRVFGDLVEGSGREPVVGAERNFADLEGLYNSIAQKRFDLRPELARPIESISTNMQLSAWEYTHEVKAEGGRQSIHVTSPLVWVLGYSTPYSLDMLRQVMTGRHKRDDASVRAFVLRACVLKQVFEKIPALSNILGGLRYRVESRRSPELGELPLITISAPVSTMRPSDDMMINAAGLAGGTHFTEVIDLDTVRDIRDPVRESVGRILKDFGEHLQIV
jgi:hypothetical protein